MKKFLALMMCLLMAFSLTCACAEEEIVVAEMLYDGVWVQFEDGFEFYLPEDWYALDEIPQEWAEQGIFYMAGTEDMSYSCTLAWQPLPREYTIEEAHAELVEEYPDAEIVEVNGVNLILSTDAEMNQFTCTALDAAEPGLYCFVFSPADDADFQILAGLIASTIRNY